MFVYKAGLTCARHPKAIRMLASSWPQCRVVRHGGASGVIWRHSAAMSLLASGVSSMVLCATHSSAKIAGRRPHVAWMRAVPPRPNPRHSRTPRTHATAVLHGSTPARRLKRGATHAMAVTMCTGVRHVSSTVSAQVTRSLPPHTPCPTAARTATSPTPAAGASWTVSPPVGAAGTTPSSGSWWAGRWRVWGRTPRGRPSRLALLRGLAWRALRMASWAEGMGLSVGAGAAVVLAAADSVAVAGLDAERAVACFRRKASSPYRGACTVLTAGGAAVGAGGTVELQDGGGNTVYDLAVASLTAEAAVACWVEGSYGECSLLTVFGGGGANISAGAVRQLPSAYASGDGGYLSLAAFDATSAAVCYRRSSGDSEACCVVVSRSGASGLASGDEQCAGGSRAVRFVGVAALGDGLAVACYKTYYTAGGSWRGRCAAAGSSPRRLRTRAVPRGRRGSWHRKPHRGLRSRCSRHRGDKGADCAPPQSEPAPT